MIDPHWQVIDLDPVTWRHLGPFFEPQNYIAAAQPGEHGLFILHDQGQLLKVVDTETRSVPTDIPKRIEDPAALANTLYERGAWQRVHVIDRRHLAQVAQRAQATPRRDLTMDAYYHLVYTLVWGDRESYVCVPAHPGNAYGWTYSQVRRFVAGLSSPATLALGVYSEGAGARASVASENAETRFPQAPAAAGALWLGLILVCEQGMIRRVTTFEGLDWHVAQPGPNEETLAALSAALSAQFAPAAAVLLCTEAVFSGWLAAADKLAYLTGARANATAIWHT